MRSRCSLYKCRHKISITTEQSMFFNIKSCNFFCCCNTKTDCLFDDCEKNKHSYCYKSCNRDNAKCLDSKHFESAAVEKSAVYCKESYHDCSAGTAKSMYANSANRIINSEYFINKLNTKYN